MKLNTINKPKLIIIIIIIILLLLVFAFAGIFVIFTGLLVWKVKTLFTVNTKPYKNDTNDSNEKPIYEFVDEDEDVICSLGTLAVLSTKRFYIKGQHHEKIGYEYKTLDQDCVFDRANIQSAVKRREPKSLMSLILSSALAVLSIILIVNGVVNCINSLQYENIDQLILGCIISLIGFILALVTLKIYERYSIGALVINIKNARIALDASLLYANEIEGFQRSIYFVENKTEGSGVNENVHVSQALSNADELKKYAELLQSGAITQDEYDAKKKQLLNL